MIVVKKGRCRRSFIAWVRTASPAASRPAASGRTGLTGISARISGRREYHGDIVTGDAWPAIITRPNLTSSAPC